MDLIKSLGQYWVWNIIGIVAFFAPLSETHAETDPKFYAVMATATVQASPAQITLRWNPDPNATGYSISRKNGNSWSVVANLPGTSTLWKDDNVSGGRAYEYRLTKSTSRGYSGGSFLSAGINVPLIDTRGKVLLLVDNTHSTALAAELRRLEWDLSGDGWTVVRRDVSRTDSVSNIKNIIRGVYNADPANLKAVFLFGHIPVPYSGNFRPDGHSDHTGAWPADLYYGDMDGNWTDSSVSNKSAHKPWNHNVPGDGKFDQSSMPSDVEVAVGRVDFYNMTCYANKTPARGELDLLRAYLNKDHQFRHRIFTVARRGLVCDNFGESGGEAFAASGWRNFGAFFGAENVTKVGYGQYFSTLATQDYLWSYGTGGGSWYTCNGIGSSDDFARTEIRSVFTMFLGSYFGDWDNESAFLRAPLGSGNCLTTSWAGRPHWYYHQMGLGETIGASTIASQNDVYGKAMGLPYWYSRQVHVALLGDPTLRMHPVIPPSNLRGTVTGDSMALTWSPSTDSDLHGYHVYRGSGPQAPFVRLTSAPIAGTSFLDPSYFRDAVYMVRAVKLERSGSGTYFNASQGIFYRENELGQPGGGSTLPQAPTAPGKLLAGAVSASQINLTWQDNSTNETGFRIDRKIGTAGAWEQAATVGANTTAYSSTGLSPGTAYYFRVVALNRTAFSMPSNESGATTLLAAPTSAAAVFAGADTSTAGNWRDVLGRDGFNVITSGSSLPGYVTVNPVGVTGYQWSDNTIDERALQNAAGTGRVAGCWFSPANFTVDLNFLDGQWHKLSLYFLDWDRIGRAQSVEILDASTGAVLDSRSIADFQNGIYLSWNAKGAIRLRLTKSAGLNAVLMGLFFDAPVISTGPSITTSSGLVAGKFQLKINGQPGQKFDVYCSEDLSSWTKISSVTLDSNSFDFVDTSSSGAALRFYRAVAAP